MQRDSESSLEENLQHAAVMLPLQSSYSHAQSAELQLSPTCLAASDAHAMHVLSSVQFAGAVSYQASRRLFIWLALILLCTALVALSVAISFPWWQYHKTVYPVILCVAAGCLVTAPVSFILGFAGFGGVAAALKEDAEAVRLCLQGCEPVQAAESLSVAMPDKDLNDCKQ